jgi:glycosyltransferase involved in cell wall biosynthesis
MPSYNHEKYISEAIDSVLNQSFRDFELTIIDDCSKDSSQKIIESYQRKDKRIRVVLHKENMGIAKTLNDGLNEARGKFIAFIASDDVWVNAKLEKQLDVLKNNEDLIIWSEGEIVDSKGTLIGETFTQMHMALQKKKTGNIFEDLLYGNFIFGSSFIVKRENIGNIRFDEQLKYLNDYRFMVDLATKYKFLFIPEPLAKYRVHGKNTILLDRKGWLKDEIMVRKYFLQKYSNEMSNRIKANLLFGIGLAYLRLGKRAVAKKFFFRAVNVNIFCKNSLLYLIFALTDGNGLIGNFLVNSYKTIDFSLIRLRRKLGTSVKIL